MGAVAAQRGEARARRIPVGWWVIAGMATFVAVYSARYFVMPANAALEGPSGSHFQHFFGRLLPHVAGGVVALLLGPWQFVSRLRARRPRLHRWMGYLYFSAVGVGSIAGFLMALVSMGGVATHLGFGLLAVAWFATALAALQAARRADFATHRRWMVRNYALTFAAVTLRIELPLLLLANLPFLTAYAMVSWLSWVPNGIAAELWLRRRIVPLSPVRPRHQAF